MWPLTLALLVCTASLQAAEPNLRICIYGDNRGASRAHRAILRQAKAEGVRLYVIAGDVLKWDYGEAGTPDAVLGDYRAVFGSVEHSLALWPDTPGPNVFVVPGGHDEQYFADPALIDSLQQYGEGRSLLEGENAYGRRLYEPFNLEFMRLRIQPYDKLEEPLPMSPYGDYLLLVGAGARRECALLMLYRTDRWGFREDQVDWVENVLGELRRDLPNLPLLAVAHDWLWVFPDSLDDGSVDGERNGVAGIEPQIDREQKQRLWRILNDSHVDLAVAADLHAYWAEADGPVLRANCASAVCLDPHGEQVAVDNLWLEYEQTVGSMKVAVHPVGPPAGCGLQPESARRFGTQFEKQRAAGAAWRAINHP